LKKEKANFRSDEVVVLTVSGRGDKDINTYVKYFESTTK